METWQILAWLVLLTAMGLLDHLAFRLHWHNPRPPRRSGGSQTEPRCTCRWPLVLALPEDMTCLVHRHMRAKE